MPPLTRCRQHLFAREDCIGPGHETHRLRRFIKCLSPSREADDGRRKHNSCRRNRSKQYMVWQRLREAYPSRQIRSRVRHIVAQCTRTELFSSGVPGIGTSAFTGKDSGCSGMLNMVQLDVTSQISPVEGRKKKFRA